MMAATQNLGLTYLTSGQLQPEVTINNDLNLLDAAFGALGAFGNDVATTSGITYGYSAGTVYSNGSLVSISGGTITLTASATNYVQRTAHGVVSANTSGFMTGLIPMATVVTGTTSITSITDDRPNAYNLESRSVVQVGAPTSVSVTTATTGGTLAASTTYTYRVSAVYPYGESVAGAEVSVTTGSGTATNTSTVNWTLPAGATEAKIYGRTAGAELLMATVAAGTSSWTDTGSVTPAGALPSGTLTLGDAQVNAQILSLQGAISGNTMVELPTYQQEWVISNDVTGSFQVNIQTSNGSPILLQPGAAQVVYGNGSVIKPTAGPAASPQPSSSVTVGASPFTYTAPAAGSVAVSGGTISQIQLVRAGVTAWTGTAASVVPVRINDEVIVTYSAAPTMYYLGD